MSTYKIQISGNKYEVLKLTRNKVYDEDDWEDMDSPEYMYEHVFRGTLVECKAYVKERT